MKKIFFIYLVLVVQIFALNIKDAYNDFNISKPIKRIVVLDYVSANALCELGAFDKIVGITKDWEEYLGNSAKNYGCDFSQVKMVGKNKSVNYESILQLKPDLVIVSKKYKDTIKKLKELNLNVYISSFKVKSNRYVDYKNVLDMGLYSLSKLTNTQKKANELLKFINKTDKILEAKLKNLNFDKKPTVMMLDKWLGTYGGNNFVNVLFQKVGGNFFLKDKFNGYKEFDPESILKFNPDYIFIQSRYADTKDFLLHHKSLSGLKAIKENHLIVLPYFAKAWGHITPEAASIGEIFIAKTLYENKFKDINLESLKKEFINIVSNKRAK